MSEVDNECIDDINILQASMKAMRAAVAGLKRAPDTVLVDGNRRPWGNPAGKMAKGWVRPADPPPPASLRRCTAVIKGDAHVRCIGAASVRMMSLTPCQLSHHRNRSNPVTCDRKPPSLVTAGAINVVTVCLSLRQVLAKVHRDRVCVALHQQYPQYGLAQHKGYPTVAHKAAVANYGPSPCHRRTFKGVKEHVK